MPDKPRTRWGDGRIEVSAKLAQIKSAKAANWPMTRIYEEYIDRTKISYSQFLRQVQNLSKAAPPGPASPVTPQVPPRPATTTAKETTASARSKHASGFEHESYVREDDIKNRALGITRRDPD